MKSFILKQCFAFVALSALAVPLLAAGCGTRGSGTGGTSTGGTGGTSTGGAGGTGGSGDCTLNPSDPTKYVIIQFWDNDTCTGDAIAENAYPVDDTTGCYCWPGHSGENSAQHFVCDKAAGTFAYDQYTNLTCGDSATHKESSTTECRVDVPATLHSKIKDMSACP